MVPEGGKRQERLVAASGLQVKEALSSSIGRKKKKRVGRSAAAATSKRTRRVIQRDRRQLDSMNGSVLMPLEQYRSDPLMIFLRAIDSRSLLTMF